MIAVRRLMFRGWRVEAGFRVRVIHPIVPAEQPTPGETHAEWAAHEWHIRRQIDRNRAEVEFRWFSIGGV